MENLEFLKKALVVVARQHFALQVKYKSHFTGNKFIYKFLL